MNHHNSPRSLFRALFVYAWTVFSATGAWAADILAEDFATLTDTALPAGWTSSKPSDLDYTGEPFVGVAAPAFKFSATGNTLTSPAFATGAASVQFWAYGNGGAGSTIAVEGFSGGSWATLDTVSIAAQERFSRTVIVS